MDDVLGIIEGITAPLRLSVEVTSAFAKGIYFASVLFTWPTIIFRSYFPLGFEGIGAEIIYWLPTMAWIAGLIQLDKKRKDGREKQGED